MAQSSVLSVPFVFWPKAQEDLRHDITVAVEWPTGLATGSSTGELVFWTSDCLSLHPRVISSPAAGLSCTDLCILRPPFHSALQTFVWVLSLHSDSRLRIWDPQDGRCVSISPRTMFPPNYKLLCIEVLQRRLVAVAGKDWAVHLVDSWSMTKLSTFICPAEILGMAGDTKEERGLLAALAGGNCLTIWTFEDLAGFLIDPAHMQMGKDCVPVASGQVCTPDTLEHVQVVGELVLLWSREKLQVLRAQWVGGTQGQVLLPLCVLLASPITAIQAGGNEIWLFLETGSIALVSLLELRRVLDCTRVGEGEIMKDVSWIRLGNPAFSGPFLLGERAIYKFQTNTVLSLHPSSIFSPSASPTQSTVSFHSQSSLSAEPELVPFLYPSEALTYSHLALGYAWPVYLIGTSLGRIFAVSLSYTTKVISFESGRKAAITSLIVVGNEEVVAAAEDGWLQTWKLELFDKVTGHVQKHTNKLHQVTSPYHLFDTHLRCISKVCCLTDLPDLSCDSQTLRRSEDWRPWQHRALLQCQDNSISLVSLEAESVLWTLYGGIENVSEVFIHLCMDYMIVLGTEGTCYTISLSTQQLERIGPASEITYHAFSRAQAIEPKEERARGSLSHQMLDFHLSSYVTQTDSSLTWAEYPRLAGVQLPVLCLHIANIKKAYSGMVSFPDQAEFLISLLNSWSSAHENLLPDSVSSLLELRAPSIRASPGTFGVEDAISFLLPSVASPWQVSGYLSALLSMSLLGVLDACSQFKPSLKVAMREVTEGHVAELMRKVEALEKPGLVVLSYEVLTGDQTAYALFRTVAKTVPEEKRRELREGWRLVLKAAMGQSEDGEESIGVGTIDVLCVLNLTVLNDSSEDSLSSDEIARAIWTVKCMLRSSDPGLQSAAVLIISDEIKTWHQRLSPDLIQSLIKVLLRLQREPKLKHLARNTLLAVGKYCLLTFFLTLKEEVVKLDKGKDHPNLVLGIMEAFLHKYYVRTSFLLTDAVAVVMCSLNPKVPSLRRFCLEKATDVLELLVKKLPMVAFEPRKQRLAVGTTTHEIWLYDLKQAGVWKKFRAHRGPLSALCFNTNGTLLASYCAFELSLKCWKIDTGFLGLGNGSVKPISMVDLSAVSPLRKRDVVETLRLRWSKEGGVEVTREDGCTYQYEL